MAIVQFIGWCLTALSAAGSAYMLAAAITFAHFMRRTPAEDTVDAPVTILKPLCGDEPQLLANLTSFARQRHDGHIQLICGVHGPDDSALRALDRIRTGNRIDVDVVVDHRRHGANGKISNLINMAAHIRHPYVVLSDSDIAVSPAYIGALVSILQDPAVGAVSCLYVGRGDAGFWSQLCAAGVSYQFLPGASFGAVRGLAEPCMGSTIAMRRETLDAIGGFVPFADTLADDHAIGAAVRATGLKTVVPPLLVTHACDEQSLAAVWRHELRWATTIRGIAPGAYAASIIALPLPIALIAVMLTPGNGAALAVAASTASRLIVRRTIDRRAGGTTAPAWLLPARDLLSFAVFVASFFVRSVDWRRRRFTLAAAGRIEPARSL